MIRVGIVESRSLIRKCISTTIGLNDGMSVVLEAADGDDLKAQLEDVAVDIVVWNFETVLEVERHWDLILEGSTMRFLLLDSYFNRLLYLKAMETMRFGYLTMSSGDLCLKKTIRSLFRKGYYFDAKLPKQWKKESGVACEGSLLNLLSKRQLEVAKEAALGKTSLEISALYSISLSTVETHRSNIMRATCSTNFIEVLLFLIRYGFFSLKDLGLRCFLGWMMLLCGGGVDEELFLMDGV